MVDQIKLPKAFKYPSDDVTDLPVLSEQLSVQALNHLQIYEASLNEMEEFTVSRLTSSEAVMEFNPDILLNISTIGPFQWGVCLDWNQLAKSIGS